MKQVSEPSQKFHFNSSQLKQLSERTERFRFNNSDEEIRQSERS